jgi:hypothetical protein
MSHSKWKANRRRSPQKSLSIDIQISNKKTYRLNKNTIRAEVYVSTHFIIGLLRRVKILFRVIVEK